MCISRGLGSEKLEKENSKKNLKKVKAEGQRGDSEKYWWLNRGKKPKEENESSGRNYPDKLLSLHGCI